MQHSVMFSEVPFLQQVGSSGAALIEHISSIRDDAVHLTLTYWPGLSLDKILQQQTKPGHRYMYVMAHTLQDSESC